MLSAADLADLCQVLMYDFENRFIVTVVDGALLDVAEQLAVRQPLRAYDAVQLATASLANDHLVQAGEPPLVFVCADARLFAIAEGEGLAVENPLRHT